MSRLEMQKLSVNTALSRLSRPIYPLCARARTHARPLDDSLTTDISSLFQPLTTYNFSPVCASLRHQANPNPHLSAPFRTLKFFSCENPSFPTLIRFQLQLIAPTYAKLRQKIFRAKCNSAGAPDFTRKQHAASSIEIQNSKFKNPSPQLPIAHAPRAPRSR